MRALLTFRIFKYVLVLTNSLTMLSGLILLGLGLTGLAKADDRFGIIGTGAFATLTAIGFLACLLSALGIVGALKEHIRSLKAFFALLLIILVLQFTVGIVAMTHAGEVSNTLTRVWSQAAVNNPRAIVYLETKFECCGLRNVTDMAVPPDCASNPSFGFQSPCLAKAFADARANMAGLGSAAIVLTLFQLVGLVSSAVLFVKLSREATAGADDFAAGGKYVGGTI